MAGYKKPAWMTKGFSFRASLRLGAAPYNPGAFQPRYVAQPTGEYNPGGGYENRELPRPSGDYNPGLYRAEDAQVQRPTGRYNPGKFQQPGTGDVPAIVDVDPWGGYYFALKISVEGKLHEVAHFMELSGLKTTATVFEIEEGGVNNRSHKRAGQSRWENLSLRYATSASTFMLEWRDLFLQDQFGKRTKYSGSIQLCRNDGEVLREYAFRNAWPVSWEGPSLNAGGSELAIETLELAHDGLDVKTYDAATQPVTG